MIAELLLGAFLASTPGPKPPPVPSVTAVNVFAIGDSKTCGNPGWLSCLISDLNATGLIVAHESPARFADHGRTVASTAAGIDAALASRSQTPTHILINLGVNDDDPITFTPDMWVQNYDYIIQACHAKWPAAKIYLARFWNRQDIQYPIEYADNVLIPNLCGNIPGKAFVGIDERACLQGDDNGYTYTFDGVHLTPEGYESEAQAWMAVLFPSP